jgi:hypothetical protein
VIEATVNVDSLPRRRPGVPGLRAGQVVTSHHGRRMRVLRTDEWVIQNKSATGPYAHLQALDDRACRVIWPRAWYLATGDQLNLFEESKA